MPNKNYLLKRVFIISELPTDGTTAFVKHASDEGIRIPDLSKIRKSPAKVIIIVIFDLRCRKI